VAVDEREKYYAEHPWKKWEDDLEDNYDQLVFQQRGRGMDFKTVYLVLFFETYYGKRPLITNKEDLEDAIPSIKKGLKMLHEVIESLEKEGKEHIF